MTEREEARAKAEQGWAAHRKIWNESNGCRFPHGRTPQDTEYGAVRGEAR